MQAAFYALYGSFSVRSHTENNNFADITLRVENGRPRIASLTCYPSVLDDKPMPEYDSDNPMLPYSHDSQMLEYDDDKQALQITKTYFTNRQSTSITE